MPRFKSLSSAIRQQTLEALADVKANEAEFYEQFANETNSEGQSGFRWGFSTWGVSKISASKSTDVQETES